MAIKPLYPPLLSFKSQFPHSKNLFIGFDGLDCVGKTTQVQLLKEKLEKKGYEVIVANTRRSTEFGRYICEAIFNEKYNLEHWDEIRLFHLVNCYIARNIVKPALHRDKPTAVIYDRTQFTAIAYQGEADGGGFEEVHSLHANSEYETIPDLNFYLKLPIGLIHERYSKRGEPLDKYENKSDEYRMKIIYGYNKCAEMYPDFIKEIDASQTIQEVSEDIWAHVLGYIDEKSSN